MASLYEQYMTSVTARDQRLEQERQRALEQQALRLRERALAEQMRAAGVSEAQREEELGLMRDQFETEKEYQDYLSSQMREATIKTKEGETIRTMLTPDQLIRLRAPEEDPYRAYQFRMTRAPIETASTFNRLLGQADFTPDVTTYDQPWTPGSTRAPIFGSRQVVSEVIPEQRFTDYGSSLSSAIRNLRPEQIEAAYVNPASLYASLGSALQAVPTEGKYETQRQNVLGMVDRALLDVGLPAFSSLSMSGLTQQQESE